MVQAGHDQRRIDHAEDGGKQPLDVGGQAHVDHRGDGVPDAPADGADDGVGDDDRRHQRTEGHHDHADDFRAVFFEELFQEDQHKAGQHGRDDLALVADHLDLGKAEIPDGDLLGGGHREAVEQLGRDQRQAQNDAEDLGGAHLFGDGPDDAHRQHVEHRLADEPQEAVHAVPEGGDIGQALGAVGKEVDLADHVAEPQDQAAADQRRDQRGEDLAQRAHDPLDHRLVGLGRRLHGVLADPFNAGEGGELVVKHPHVVADDDLELTGLGEGAFDRAQPLNLHGVCLGRVHQHKPHPRHAVGHRLDVLFAADQAQQRLDIVLVFPHGAIPPSWLFRPALRRPAAHCPYDNATCSNKSIVGFHNLFGFLLSIFTVRRHIDSHARRV